jgi:hypothetical protein
LIPTINVLETVWSGTLEREGKAAGLSTFSGRSSLFHSANWERLDTLEHGEVRGRVPMAERVKVDDSIRDRILQRLKFGMTYGQIMAEIGVSASVIRRIARRHGIDRRGWAGSGWKAMHRPVAA